VILVGPVSDCAFVFKHCIAQCLSKTHLQEVLTTGALSIPGVALMAIDTRMELVFWHKLHQLGKNCLSEMHFRSNNGRNKNTISNR
jgi:hypothetical protein